MTMTTTLQPRVEKVMGTAIGITADAPAHVIDEAFGWFHWVDDTFSTYQPDSEISRLGRGEMHLDDASTAVRHVLAMCDEIEQTTGGRFTARPDSPDLPPLDPSGLVKGWSVDEAAMILRLGHIDDFMINAGGDILCSGTPPGEDGWPIGILHPLDPGAVAAVITMQRGAVATSATYERGDHIWGRRGEQSLLSATVIGPDLALSDALATAVFADPEDVGWISSYPGYELFLIGTDQQARWTPGLDDRISLLPDRTT
jgi:thiamine biosynthesis lipoprotein